MHRHRVDIQIQVINKISDIAAMNLNLNQSTMNQGQQSTTDQLKNIPPQQTTLTTSTSTSSKSYQSSRRSSTSSNTNSSNLTIRTLSDETINEIKRMLTNSRYDIDGTLDDDTINGIKMMMPIIHHPVPPTTEYDSDMSSLHTDHDDGSSCMQCELEKE